MKTTALALACLAGFPHAPAGALAPPARASVLDASGAVRIVGYNDMAGMVARWDALFARLHPGVRFAPDLPATRAAPPALIAGRSLLAPMGAEMTPQDLAALQAADGAPPIAIAVAHDSLSPKALSGPLGVIVSQDNPLQALTLDQVARIFADGGGVTTWGDLGLTGAWRDRQVHRIGLKSGTALADALRARAFPGRDYDPAVRGLAQSREVAQAVAEDPDAVGFASLNAAGGARALAIAARAGETPIRPTRDMLRTGLYPLDRQLLIYARRPLDPVARAYLELVLSCEGQAAVAADPLGYIPLTPAQAAAERAKFR
jgi:phosphate transport system substrate-binding protein